MILSKDKNKLFYFMLIAYAFFAFLKPLSSTFFIILCALIVLSVIVLDDSHALGFWAFASCFMSCFNIETMFSKTLAIAMGIFIIKHLILATRARNKKNILFISLTLALCLILFVYGLFVTNFRIYKIVQSLSIILTIITFFLIGKVSIKHITLCLSLGLIVSSLCSSIAYACGILTTSPFIVDSVSSFRFSAYFNNINALALYCSLCQTCILSLFLSKKLEVRKWFWLAILITAIGLLTFSKTFIIITIISYCIAILLGFIRSSNKKRYIKSLLIGVVIVAILALILHNYIEVIIKRFFDDSTYVGTLNIVTTGRIDIWKFYIEKWTSSPLYILFGCGVTANNVNGRTAHSFYISLLYKFGIVGTLILIAILVYIFKNLKAHKSFGYYLPLIVLLINGLVEDIACGLYTCLPLLIAMCFVVKNKNINNEVKVEKSQSELQKNSIAK